MRIRSGWLAAIAGGLTGVPALPVAGAAAADLTITVIDQDGAPVQGAVATLSGPGIAGSGQASAAIIDQSDEMFQPAVTVVPLGGQVVFRNSDVTRHHVYSFSPPKPFELLVSPDEETAPVTFDQPGVVALGCNIHDHMVAWVHVTGEGSSLRTGEDGSVGFSGLGDGAHTVTVWHPRLRPGQQPPETKVEIAGADAGYTIALRLLPQRRHSRERQGY